MNIDALSRPEVIPQFEIDGFIIREEKIDEMDEVYFMGMDVWGQEYSLDEYMSECRGAHKYPNGTWYILEKKSEITKLNYNL